MIRIQSLLSISLLLFASSFSYAAEQDQLKGGIEMPSSPLGASCTSINISTVPLLNNETPVISGGSTCLKACVLTTISVGLLSALAIGGMHIAQSM